MIINVPANGLAHTGHGNNAGFGNKHAFCDASFVFNDFEFFFQQ